MGVETDQIGRRVRVYSALEFGVRDSAAASGLSGGLAATSLPVDQGLQTGRGLEDEAWLEESGSRLGG